MFRPRALVFILLLRLFHCLEGSDRGCWGCRRVGGEGVGDVVEELCGDVEQLSDDGHALGSVGVE